MGSILEQAYLALIGALSVGAAAALAGYIIHASHAGWRVYERLYRARDRAAPLASKMTGMIRISRPGVRWGDVSGRVPSHRYPPVMVGVHADGLTLSIAAPFRYGCHDLFLPFAAMRIAPANWDFMSDVYGVQMEGADGIEILMFPNILHWAAEKSELLGLMLRRADVVRRMQAV